MSDQTQNLAIPVTSFDGSASSNNGEGISISFTASSGGQADLIIPVDRAIDLMTLASAALGKAVQIREKNEDQLYVLPAGRFRVYETPGHQTLIWSFLLLGGAEMCFQVDKIEAQGVYEALGVLLGLHGTSPIPRDQKN